MTNTWTKMVKPSMELTSLNPRYVRYIGNNSRKPYITSSLTFSHGLGYYNRSFN